MLEFLSTYIEAIILFISGGGLATLLTAKYTRKTAQADAMKAMQSVYQEIIKDQREDKEIMKKENQQMREKIRTLEEIVKQNCVDISDLKGHKCVVPNCLLRRKE